MAANLVTLLHYLQFGPPSNVNMDDTKRKRTVSGSYSARDISTVRRWSEFQWPHIQETYGALLNTALIADEFRPQSPADPVNSKSCVRWNFIAYLQRRLIRSLRAGFAHLQSSSALPPNMTILSFGTATEAPKDAAADDALDFEHLHDRRTEVETEVLR